MIPVYNLDKRLLAPDANLETLLDDIFFKNKNTANYRIDIVNWNLNSELKESLKLRYPNNNFRFENVQPESNTQYFFYQKASEEKTTSSVKSYYKGACKQKILILEALLNQYIDFLSKIEKKEVASEYFKKFSEIKIDDRSIAILNKHRNLFFRLLQWIFGPELVPTTSAKAAKEMRNSFYEKVSQLS